MSNDTRARLHPAFLIIGTARSGTTLLQRIMSGIPGVRIPPETFFFSHFVPGLIDRQKFPLDAFMLRQELEIYSSLQATRQLKIRPEAIIDDLGGTCLSPIELFSAIVRQLAGDGTVYGEKSTPHLQWWRVIGNAMSDVKFIGIVRDPRAVVASALNVPFGPNSHVLIAENWAHDQELMLEAAAELGPARCRIIRYEELVSEPDRIRMSLGAFIEGRTPGQVESGQEPEEVADPDVSSFVLPFEWWKSRVFDPITDERVSAWKNSLTARQVADIEAVCLKGMRTFGYAQRPIGWLRAINTIVRLPLGTQLRRLRYRRSRRQSQRRIGTTQLS